jgi:hypothetical protein
VIDHRAQHFAGSKPEWLDRTNDIDALAAEAFGSLERAHMAHWQEDATLFLRSITRAGEKVVRIGKIAREASGLIEAAPAIPPEQVEIWTRPDGGVVHCGKTAA